MNLSANTPNYDYISEKFSIAPACLRNERGAIDLASIMVGIIVIAMVGAIIAATVFIVIPWNQDNAAKQQMQSIVSAEDAHMGLSSNNSTSLPAGTRPNSFADSFELAKAGLLQQGAKYCTLESTDGKNYTAYVKSATGKVFTATNTNTKPQPYTGSLPYECSYVQTGTATEMAAPYVDPTPTMTTLTYKCDTTVSGTIPMQDTLTGTETWNDGTPAITYNGAAKAAQKTLNAGIEYKVTFDGTYKKFNSTATGFIYCLRSVDHWGKETGVTDASSAFSTAQNLTSVPENIPDSITNMSSMFLMAASFNDANVSRWNVSNVTDMNNMFASANTFNQPLDRWNTSKVTNMSAMFWSASKFNQNISSWDVSKVANMSNMFNSATAYNSPLNDWSVSNVTTMSNMFYGASTFNQSLDKWNVNAVTNMDQTFLGAKAFNQNISGWNTNAGLVGTRFADSTFPDSYLPPRVSK